MNEPLWRLLLGFAAVIVGIEAPLCWLLFRTVGALVRSSGAAHRERDRERRDCFRMIERAVEKARLAPEAAAHLHARERSDGEARDFDLQRKELSPPAAPVPAAPVEDPDGEPALDPYLALDND